MIQRMQSFKNSVPKIQFIKQITNAMKSCNVQRNNHQMESYIISLTATLSRILKMNFTLVEMSQKINASRDAMNYIFVQEVHIKELIAGLHLERMI
jgi:hypothetical protein